MTTDVVAPGEFDPSVVHGHEMGEVFTATGSSPDGLTAEEAGRRLVAFGPNRLPEPARRGALVRFVSHFSDVLILVLIGAAVVTAVLQHWLDTAVIVAVVVINATIGFVQEGRAEQAIDAIRRMLSVRASVRRDGTWQEIDAQDVVPGDVVRLRAGDRVPADARLFEVATLSIEESALTGESLPSEKTTGAVDPDAPVGDRDDMAYSGCLVAQGHGLGVVTATGSTTEIGRINRMIAQVEAVQTPLTKQMSRFGSVLSVVILGLAVVLVFIGWTVHGDGPAALLMAAIGFAVAAIPEGLPAILTITLAIGVQRMARRNAITRRLDAVETLGSVTVICSDKTGTLTRNEMTVREVVTAAGTYQVTGIGYRPDGHLESEGQQVPELLPPSLDALVEVMAVCNDSTLAEVDGEWTVHGDPTEGALKVLSGKARFDVASHRRLAVVPFQSENKLMATLEVARDGRRHVLVKGAPERLLERCDRQLDETGRPEVLQREWWEQRARSLAAEGMRVLAAARRPADDATETLELGDLDDGLVFAGLVGILDPPRPSAIDSIEVCRGAGIRVKMITGDHAGTAGAIATEMGISSGGAAITGPEIEAASDDELVGLVGEHDVFARTSPEHKLRIVTALQRRGEVVAMTGDGVNDAPALKRADVGVAMGIKGSEATKEAAEIVLADDNFESIERAVEEGRTIYDNLRKSILFILPTNGAQSGVMLAAVVFGLDLPLTPVQILWVNMITSVTLALAFAFESAEPGLMQRAPRRPGGSIIDAAFLRRLVLVSLLMGGATITMFLATEATGRSVEFARTVALNTLVVSQVFYLFNSRFLRAPSRPPRSFRGNPAVWWAVGSLAVLQLTFVYAPFMHALFQSEPLPL
ncbi:MAG: HAD-IC family P-type ATPase, partial [Microthrixaceae bacterium]